VKLIGDAEKLTNANEALTLVVAFNYGGRQEIVRAARRVAKAARAGEIDPDKIDEADFERHLDTAGLPDPELIIRTSGELRLSNFLLWQSAYAEFVVMPVHWPDFDRVALEQALDEFRRRQRRFGGLEARARA
jgi:undecaprenyl diphosphate synthase